MTKGDVGGNLKGILFRPLPASAMTITELLSFQNGEMFSL